MSNSPPALPPLKSIAGPLPKLTCPHGGPDDANAANGGPANPASLAWGALLDASSDLLALLGPHGQLLWANAGFELTSGYQVMQVRGQSVVDLMSPQAEGLEGWEAVRSDLFENRGFDAVELAWRDQAGQARWGRLSMQALKGAAPQSGIHWLMALHDLTDLRASTQHAKRVCELLETAQEFGRLGAWERKLPHGPEQWDHHMFRFFGRTPKDGPASFEHVLQALNPDPNAHANYSASLRCAGKHSQRYRIEVPGQPVRHVHAQWEVKTSAAGLPHLVTGILMDDTEAYTLALSFHETSEQLKLAVDLGNIAIWRHDIKTDRIYYNERAVEVLNLPYQAEGWAMSQVHQMVHPDDWATVQSAQARSLRTDRPVDAEIRYRHPDGPWRYVLTRRRVVRDEQGQPQEFVGVALDVSEQVAKTRHASEMTKRLEIAASAAGLGIWSRDPLTRRAEWNSQMFEIVGRDPAQGLPSRKEWFTQIVHPDDQAGMAHANLDLMASNGAIVEHEYRIKRPDGQVRWLVNRARREVRDGLIMHFGITMDVTERRHTETERHEKMMAVQASLAKSEFLARMSHELRTPLNAVLGFSQLLSLDERLVSTQRERVQRIHAAGEHLLCLINDVLDISSLEQGQLHFNLQPVPLVQVTQEALPLVENLAQAQGIRIHSGALYGVAFADRTRLRQVLINLLTNAIKYNRPHGAVVLSSETQDTHIVLRVSDTGRGMSGAQQAKLFEPFNRLGLEKENIAGAGIGLALVKALVERMDGTIHVSSEIGVGSEFEIHLPRWAGVSGISQPIPLAPPSQHGPLITPQPRVGQVLYIEDNPINQMLVEELVRHHIGMHIESVDTGLAGIERALVLRPQLILIDIQLPDIDGFEVLKRLRAQASTRHIPCVALSANAMAQDIERALSAGFDDYWTKPIHCTTFIQAIDRLFHHDTCALA